MYTGQLTITSDNCIALLASAKQLIMDKLEESCNSHFSSTLSAETVFKYLRNAIVLHQQDIIEKCIAKVTSSSTLLARMDDMLTLPLNVFSQIILHQTLQVNQEFDVYQLIVEYLKKNSIKATSVHYLIEAIK